LSQLVRSIRLQWAQGGGDAVIRLEPRHFGDVRVALRVDQGQVTARLNVEAPAAREWLQNNQTWLRGSLSDHGLTLSRLEVTEPANESFDHGRRQTDREAAREKSQDQGHRRPRKPSTGERFETFV
jgi:flagellar hook-length control protein FliK